jgi:hypothetical protein
MLLASFCIGLLNRYGGGLKFMTEPANLEQSGLPGQAASEARDRAQEHSGGDALLDSQVEANQQQPEDETLEDATATNLSDEEV